MDPRSGELVRDISAIDPDQRERFVPVPNKLLPGAFDALDGNERAFVPLRGPSTLAAWARERVLVRTKNRKRNKIAKASRRKNRS